MDSEDRDDQREEMQTTMWPCLGRREVLWRAGLGAGVGGRMGGERRRRAGCLAAILDERPM